MERNEFADQFADCVVRRTEYDTVMKPGIVILTMALPALLVLAVVTLVIDANLGTNFTEEGVRAGILVALMVECCIIGFLLYALSSRTQRHQARDDIWTEALVGYARSKGSNVTELEKLGSKLHRRGRFPLRAVALVLWGISVLFLLAIGVYLGLLTSPLDNRLFVFGTVSYLLLILQFLLSTGATYGFPRGHEKRQIAFTEEFSARMGDVGIDMPAMKPLVGKAHWVVCIVLFIVTLGLFSIVMFLLACRNMNLHIHNQWGYEKDVLQRIMDTEGGKSVRPVEGSRMGVAQSFLKSIF